ncbi:MAG: TIM-barrel domain-containing protein [Bacteroidales bacterium]
MKKLIILIILFQILTTGFSQVAWLIPSNPSVKDTITLFYNAAEGNQNLKGHTGDVYLHAGVITNKSLDGHDWKYVVGNWGTPDQRVLMKREKDDLYSFRFVPSLFYGLKPEDKAQQLSFVFRNTEGTIVGKTADNEDILVPVEGYKPPVKDNKKNANRELIFNNLTTTSTGWEIQTNTGSIVILPYSDYIWEAEFLTKDSPPRDSSHAVILKPGKINKNTYSTTSGYRLDAGNISVLVNKSPLSLTWLYKNDTLFKEGGGFYKGPGNSSVRFSMSKDEKIYGTGERSVPMNRRGNIYPLYNRPYYGYETNALMLNYSVPVIVSSKKYIVLWDNPQKGTVDIGKTEKDIIEWSAIGGPARFLVVAADSYPGLMEHYTELTGRQPLPPRWALGNLQSRMAYRNQEETDSIVGLMIEKGFPIDAIILDFYWFGDSILGYLGALDWYKKSWPEPVAMINKFKKLGVNTILITEPYIIDSMPNFKIAADLGILATDSTGKAYVNHQFYFGPGGLLDIFKPEARDWFWEKYDKQIRNGVAAWWGDLGEPESHPSDIYHINGKADEVHNIYGHYWDRMLFEKYRKYYPRTRLFHLQRSGYAGTQRFSAFPWTGDVSRSWGGYQAQLPLLLTMSLNGLGYIHSDAGGFAQGVKDEELFTRWLQFAAFTPILRPHGSGIPSEPVFFSENTQEIVKKYIKLRYKLLPYIYTLAYTNTLKGEPLMRPLFYYHSDDSSAVNTEDQYYWGEKMMIVPILKKGITSKKIYLPEGEWMDFHTASVYKGKNWIEYPLSLQEMPIFIKKGSIIPMTSEILTTRDYNYKYLKLFIYPDTRPFSFTQFEDDGHDALSIVENNFETIEYQAIPKPDGLSFNFTRTGKWMGAPESRKMELQIRHPGKTAVVKINGKTIKPINDNNDNKPVDSYRYNEPWLYIEFLWSGDKANIELSY